MGIGDFLFGSEPETKVEPTSTLSPQQQAILKQLSGYFGGEGSIAKAGEAYTGDIAAGASPLQETSLAALEQQALQGVGGTSKAAGSTLTDILHGGPGDIQKYFEETVQKPLMRQYEDIFNATSRRYAPSGFYGSERIKSEDKSRRDLLDALTREQTRVGFEERNRDLQTKLQAAGLAGQVDAGQLDPLLKLLEAGGTQRGIDQDKLTADYLEYQRQKDEQEKRVKAMIASLGIPTTENIVTQEGGSPGLLSSVAPIVGGYLGTTSGSNFLTGLLKG